MDTVDAAGILLSRADVGNQEPIRLRGRDPYSGRRMFFDAASGSCRPHAGRRRHGDGRPACPTSRDARTRGPALGGGDGDAVSRI